MKIGYLYKIYSEWDDNNYFYISSPKDISSYIANSPDRISLIDLLENENIEFVIIPPENCDEIICEPVEGQL